MTSAVAVISLLIQGWRTGLAGAVLLALTAPAEANAPSRSLGHSVSNAVAMSSVFGRRDPDLPPPMSRRLGSLIDQAIRAEGPFFTPEEQAVIRRKCGYSDAEWDGIQFQSVNDIFFCENGRRLDDAEVRAILIGAAPRINTRVGAIMNRPEIVEAVKQATLEQLRRK